MRGESKVSRGPWQKEAGKHVESRREGGLVGGNLRGTGEHGSEAAAGGRNGGSDVNATAASINVTSVITCNLREGLLVRQYAYLGIREDGSGGKGCEAGGKRRRRRNMG